MISYSLEGKVALVTGGARGLGRMIAEGFLQCGARVIITSRKNAKVAADEMSGSGACHGITNSLDGSDAYDALLTEVEKLTDKVHIVVNNAGRTWGDAFSEFPDKAWSNIMTTNVHTPFAVIQRLLPLLERAASPDDPARVINIGSIAGTKVQRLNAFSYGASKAALHHLSKDLAAELAGRGITVNTVLPGFFPTNMAAHICSDEDLVTDLHEQIPLGRLGEAKDIIGACTFLASPFSSYITGTEITVDGGLSCT